MEQVQDQTLVISEVKEGFDTLFLESLVVRVLVTTHCVNHLLTDTDWRLKHGLGRRVLAKDESKIDVEQMTQFVYHQIFQMTIAHCHQIGNCAVSSTTLDINVNYLIVLVLIEGFLNGVFSIRLNMMLTCSKSFEEVFYPVFVIF